VQTSFGHDRLKINYEANWDVFSLYRMDRPCCDRNHLFFQCRRKNYVKAAYVNAALALLDSSYSHQLMSILRVQGVPEDVIARVLGTDGPFREYQSR